MTKWNTQRDGRNYRSFGRTSRPTKPYFTYSSNPNGTLDEELTLRRYRRHLLRRNWTLWCRSKALAREMEKMRETLTNVARYRSSV